MPKPTKKKPLQRPADVVTEIRRRKKAGHPLNSGANRGDWLYAAAVRHFGSWQAAVEAAGVIYADVKQADLSKDDVLHRIQETAARGQPLRAGGDRVLASGARRHFGSWRAAVVAAGFEVESFLVWTPEAVVERIRADLRSGLSVRSTDVIAREERLYIAGRRRFGSWGAALKAADPSLPEPRTGRPKTKALPVDVQNKTRQRTPKARKT